MPARHTEADREGPGPMAIADARVPLAVRVHGLRFAPPACLVEAWGPDEYALLSADGELLDVVFLESPRAPGPVAAAVLQAASRWSAASVCRVLLVLFMVLPSAIFLFRAWTTQSLHWLMAGLLMSLVSALVFLVCKLIMATK